MTLELTQWVQQYYGQEIMRPGLERVSEALRPLLNDLQKCKIVTIAGTNGKGETSLRLSKLLSSRNHCTWISPHVRRITERFVSEEGEISLVRLQELVWACHADVQNRGLELSFYEFLFYVFCTWALERQAEVLVLEVGLGGRLDAVNALGADLVLLTSVSRDHQEILGSRYDQILQEKLGVLRPGKGLISFLGIKYLRERADEFASKKRVTHIDLDSISNLRTFEFSARNQLLAYAAFKHLSGVALEELGEHLANSGWEPKRDGLENRGEVLSLRGNWSFYGSHNPDGLRKLIQFLGNENYNFNQLFDLVLASFSRRSEADVKIMLKMLKCFGQNKVSVCSFQHPKAFDRERLMELANLEGLKFVPDIDSYIHDQSGRTLVVGSYYFLGHVRSLISS